MKATHWNFFSLSWSSMRHCGLLMIALLVLGACANRGVGPQGGPRDSVPPQVVDERPANGTLHFSGNRIEIRFDEYMQLKDVASNVIISPPQLHAPQIQSFGKKLLITFEDTLIANSTYTIDFGSAIVDNNEQIPLAGYTYSFSTGDNIDSLGIFGQVIYAEDLNPISGITIGLQEELNDSAFETQSFTRIARSDSLGYFSIKNIRPGKYRVYALKDNSGDYRYQPGEALAFNDVIYEPYTRVEVVDDSTEMIYLEPSDVVLWFFQEDKQSLYFQRATHSEPHLLTLTFSAPFDSLPSIRALRPSEVDSSLSDGKWIDWTEYAQLQASRHNDTLTYWLTDSVAMLDSLFMELTYLRTDSVYNYYWKTDTIKAIYHAPRVNARTQAKLAKQRAEKSITIKTNAKSSFEVYDTLRFAVDAPLRRIEKDSIHLTRKIDTIITTIPFVLHPMDSSYMQFQCIAKLEPEKEYTLLFDSAAMEDVFGHVNNQYKSTVKVKSMEEYATLRIRLSRTGAYRMQLLNDKDKVVRDEAVGTNGAYFTYLPAGVYYARVYEDKNGDGKWTTGDWMLRRQPEPVYYFPARLQLRANWDFEERFDMESVPQLEAKPFELIKDGAEALKKKK